MNRDYTYCGGYKQNATKSEQPQTCQRCKRFWEQTADAQGNYWFMFPEYNEVTDECENFESKE